MCVCVCVCVTFNSIYLYSCPDVHVVFARISVSYVQYVTCIPSPLRALLCISQSYCINNMSSQSGRGESVYVLHRTHRFSSADTQTDTHRHTHRQTSVPYDSGQVYLVFSRVWSVREEGIPHAPTGTRKTLGTRLTHRDAHFILKTDK